ncbi:hypothetical protein [uncultured Tateyamaria sp.]|uniref:hypothetical protein n=1 Tax=uncultured Tateyamaria sp. TaxID=455651 RepID=UPI0026149A76|nr:hypothetical protein [uncultured Tateyamaria sp.]
MKNLLFAGAVIGSPAFADDPIFSMRCLDGLRTINSDFEAFEAYTTYRSGAREPLEQLFSITGQEHGQTFASDWLLLEVERLCASQPGLTIHEIAVEAIRRQFN